MWASGSSVESVRPLSSDGAIAQLGERLLCKQEVVGSVWLHQTFRSCRAVLIANCDRGRLRKMDRRLQNAALQSAANKQLLVRAKSIRRVVDLASMALVGGARVI
jgi:hypothetical protein